MRVSAASVAAACLIGTACGGGDLVLPGGSSNPPAGLEAVRGNGQNGAPGSELPEPIVVKVTDDDGAPVVDARVAFELGAGAEGGATSPDTAVTGANGEASTVWVLGGETGQQRVTAEVVGADLEAVSFTATAVEDAPVPSAGLSSVVAAPATIQAATELSIITVTVRDGRGDPMPGATVTLAATGPGNVLIQPSAPTGADGVAEGTLQSLVPGRKVVSAVVNGAVAVEETAEVEVVVTQEPEPDRLAFLVQPSDTEENETIAPPVSVAVVDDDGDVVPVSGVQIRLELIGDDGDEERKDLKGQTTQVTVNGVAVFTDLRVDRDEEDYRLRATAPDRPELGSVDSETFDVDED